MEVFTKSARETQKLGQEFANRLAGGEVLALTGRLGSGKTTFLQGLAQGLGVRERVISPTFILMREYALKSKEQKAADRFKESENIKKLYHIDLYRLEEDVEEEFKGLGVEDIWGKRDNIIAVEWAEKVRGLLPERTVWVKFEVVDENKRRIAIK